MEIVEMNYALFRLAILSVLCVGSVACTSGSSAPPASDTSSPGDDRKIQFFAVAELGDRNPETTVLNRLRECLPRWGTPITEIETEAAFYGSDEQRLNQRGLGAGGSSTDLGMVVYFLKEPGAASTSYNLAMVVIDPAKGEVGFGDRVAPGVTIRPKVRNMIGLIARNEPGC
jgi:hypothetical protein